MTSSGRGPVDRDLISLVVNLRGMLLTGLCAHGKGPMATLDDMHRVLTCVCAWLERLER